MSSKISIDNLIKAASDGDINTVRALLDRGVDINGKNDKFGFTALMKAATNNKESVVSLLLDKRADVNIKNKHGYTALDIAKNNGCDGVVAIIANKATPLEVSVAVVDGETDQLQIQRINNNSKSISKESSEESEYIEVIRREAIGSSGLSEIIDCDYFHSVSKHTHQ